jgi:hypothetical protein
MPTVDGGTLGIKIVLTVQELRRGLQVQQQVPGPLPAIFSLAPLASAVVERCVADNVLRIESERETRDANE